MFETFDRSERNAREEQVKAEVAEHFAEQFEGREQEVADALYNVQKEVMRRHIIDKGVRPDGRKLTEVRPIWCEVGVLPRPHGSGVFTRGQTQVMTVATLAPVSEQQIIDGIGTENHKRYMHHYNFPGYSTGEAKPSRSPGGGVPVLPAPGLRGHELQRLHLPGFRLRQHPGPDGRGRADQAPRGRRGHGPDQGR